jgi:nucleoid DNA-binding protein
MKKQEFIQNVITIAKDNNIKLNKDTASKLLDIIEETIDGVIVAQDQVTIMGMKFETKLQKGRTGTINLGSRAGETYSTPDKIVPSVKFIKSKKDSLTR